MADKKSQRLKQTGASVLDFFLWLQMGIARRIMTSYQPRVYHNTLLRRYLCNLNGDIANVSGWDDRDKQGGRYQDYFGEVHRYVITNIAGTRGLPSDLYEGVEWRTLDLEETPVPSDLIGAFDVVMSITVLEHIFDITTALRNLCAISRDVIVVVIPFSQSVHYTTSYGDYVRLTPQYFRRALDELGFQILLSAANEQSFYPVYLTIIASRRPKEHVETFRDAPIRYDINILPGRFGRDAGSGLDGSED